MAKIFCFIDEQLATGDVIVRALAEDGTHLAAHFSSSVRWAKHDIGITSDWKHEHYKKHYPDSYELVWVDDPETHEDIQPAIALARQKYPEDAEG